MENTLIIHCVSELEILTGFPIWPRWSQAHTDTFCPVLNLDLWLVLGDISEDGFLVAYLTTSLLIKPTGVGSQSACNGVRVGGGKSGPLGLWLFPETERSKVMTLWWACGGRHYRMGNLDVESGAVVDGSSGHQPLRWDQVAGRRKAARAFQRKREVDTLEKRTDVEGGCCPSLTLGWGGGGSLWSGRVMALKSAGKEKGVI